MKKMVNKINQSLKNPKIIPWLGNTNFSNLKNIVSKIFHILLCTFI